MVLLRVNINKKMKQGRRISNIPKEQVLAEKMYLKGIKMRSIAWGVGVSLMTIYRWVKKYDWESAYKKKYEEDLSKIEDEMGKIFYMCRHRRLKGKRI